MTFFRFIFIFFLVCLISSLSLMTIGNDAHLVSYWQVHGIFLLGFFTIFPRLALLLSSVPFGGILWWLGFFFCPRYLIAILATLNYSSTNPILVTFAWLVALGGESTEKYILVKRRFNRPDLNKAKNPQAGKIIDISP